MDENNTAKTQADPRFSTKEHAADEVDIVDAESEDVQWRLRLSSSDTFEKIMKDIEGKMVERVKNQIELRRQLALAMYRQKTMNNQNDSRKEMTAGEEELSSVFDFDIDIDDVEENEEETAAMKHLKARAQRGWTIIRRHVREEAMKKKTENKSSMQWSMLKHTMKQMRNMDSAREDLYKKYLHPENPRSWADGMTSIPSDFFAKYGRAFRRSLEEDTKVVTTKKKSSRKSNSAKSQAIHFSTKRMQKI